MTRLAGSLSMAITVCVDKISEFWSSATALIIPAKLSPPLRSPNPPTRPEEFSKEEVARLLNVALSPCSIAEPARDSKSGLAPF